MMKIAVEGCCHDQLEVIYDTISLIQTQKNIKIDLLLICGDFQATRNRDDLQCMAVPPKYRGMKYFYKYYKGERVAPILTVVIGGNHEASNHMQELPYGGWLAQNIYYLGYAGIINVGGVRIGGMSGIYSGKDFHKGHFECPPYSGNDMRSCYHTRSLEVFRLKQIHSHVDIMLSHDWPLHAVHAGDVNKLLRWKPNFKDEIDTDTLGSPAAQDVLNHIKPSYWFSAHLHCKYPAVIKHKCPDGEEAKITQFLALDKCLPRRQFLQVFDMPSNTPGPYKIELDAEWLCILKNTNHLLNLTSSIRYMPGVGCSERYDFKVTQKEKDSLLADFDGNLTLPENFEVTVTPYDGVSDVTKGRQPECQVNPQTTLLCEMLGLTDPFDVFSEKSNNPDEINLDLASDESDGGIEFRDDDQQEADGVSTTEEFPTFLHSMTANESVLNDSSDTVSSSAPNNSDTVGSTAPVSSDTVGSTAPDSSNSPTNQDDIQPDNKKRHSQDDDNTDTKQELNVPQGSSTKRLKRRNVAIYSILSNQHSADSDTNFSNE